MSNNRTKFSGSRRYPTPVTVTDDLASHTLALQQLIEAVGTGQRHTRDTGSSFIRLHELEDIGLIKLVGKSFTITLQHNDVVGTQGGMDGEYYHLSAAEYALVQRLHSGDGSPEGVLTADPGHLYLDNTGGKLYVKESGAGNTGWVQK